MKTKTTVRNILAKRKKSFIITAEANFVTKIKPSYIQAILLAKYEETMKKEWNLKEIDKDDLDWDWKEVKIKWEVSFPRSSGVLNIMITCPDQKVSIIGGVDYTDENDKDHSYDFTTVLELNDVECNYDKVKINDDIAPSELEYSNKKFELKF